MVGPGTRVVAVVTGYFGERLAQVCERYDGHVTRVQSEWGRACEPGAVRRALSERGAQVVVAVHGETSTGVVNPIGDVVSIAREHGALTIVDAVTSLGAYPLEVKDWEIDVCYSCTQKGLGAPSGLSPVTFSARAMSQLVDARGFYFDLALLRDYWLSRKYHHTISAPLIYALHAALLEIEDEGLDERWSRHQRCHQVLVAGLSAMGLSLLPPESERLWSLNAIKVPASVDEAGLRRHLLEVFDIEIGAGLGPLAGQIWRVGFMGGGATSQALLLFLAAFEHGLKAQGFSLTAGAGTGAAIDALAS